MPTSTCGRQPTVTVGELGRGLQPPGTAAVAAPRFVLWICTSRLTLPHPTPNPAHLQQRALSGLPARPRPRAQQRQADLAVLHREANKRTKGSLLLAAEGGSVCGGKTRAQQRQAAGLAGLPACTSGLAMKVGRQWSSVTTKGQPVQHLRSAAPANSRAA